MLLRRLLLPAVALLLAGGAAMFARDWLEEQRRPVAPEAAAPMVRLKQVLVAAEDLHVGRFLGPDTLRWQDWPDVSLPSTYIVEGTGTMEDLAGAVVRLDVAAGQPITRAAIVKPGDRGFLAAVLDPGMRAVSVPVDEASSNAGLIFPGDRVDLILTQTIGGDGETRASARRVSETVLENVRVIAMGRNLRGDPAEEIGPTASQIRTTTLEVTPEGAERVALVTELGKLSLSLRSLARADEGEPIHTPDGAGRITWDSDVARVLRPENQPVSTMALIRGRESSLIALPKGALQ
jgi:pilus assembly protein CpaB